MKILITEPDRFSTRALEVLNKLGEVTLGPVSRPELLQVVADYEILFIRLGHSIDKEILNHATHLKAIVSPTTGLDHIDTAAARQKGLIVLSLKGEVEFLRSIPATAELTWGLLLSLVRNIPEAVRSVNHGEWDRDKFRGNDLAGKQIGILGYGRIGEKIAAYALAFGMHVCVYELNNKNLPAGVNGLESMRNLFETSDILSIHIPLDETTVGLIDAEAFSYLKPGCWLVNTSRGEIVNEQALIASLENGRLRGAAVDVIYNERNLQQQPSILIEYARTHRNLIITPHIGGATIESMENTELFMVEKLRKFLASQAANKVVKE